MKKKSLAKIQPYYKFELAELYRVNRKKLMFWIYNIDEILQIFKETGYKKTQNIFSLKQVEAIFKYLGHPLARNNNEVHTYKKAEILPYNKKDISELYGISGRLLISQINSIPDYEVKKQIMDAGKIEYYYVALNKKLFRKNEVDLIFKYLGHPYISE